MNTLTSNSTNVNLQPLIEISSNEFHQYSEMIRSYINSSILGDENKKIAFSRNDINIERFFSYFDKEVQPNVILNENNIEFTFFCDDELHLKCVAQLLYALQFFPNVRRSIVKRFNQLAKKCWKTNAQQKQLISFFDIKKENWDAMLRGDSRLKFEYIKTMADRFKVSLLDFLQTNCVSVTFDKGVMGCQLYFGQKEGLINGGISSELIVEPENSAESADEIKSLVEKAASSKMAKKIIINRLLIGCIWSIAYFQIPGNTNGNICSTLNLPSNTFSRLKQKQRLDEELLKKAVEAFEINLDFLDKESDLLGMPMEQIEDHFNRVKKDPILYNKMRENFLDKILNYTHYNISEAERVFMLGKNAISRFKEGRTKLSLFWLIRACATLDIPVTEIMPRG